MRPNTRLIIRLSFKDGSMKIWGYDYPYYRTSNDLVKDIEKDFATIPENTEIRLFYYDQEGVIAVKNNKELAEKTIQWLMSTGSYN